MTERDDRERRAREALIVSRLRAGCDDEGDPNKLPAITAADKENLQCLKPDFIDRLLARPGDFVRLPEEFPNVEQPQQPIGGLLRADEFDDASVDEVTRKRRAIQQKLKEERDGRDDQPSS